MNLIQKRKLILMKLLKKMQKKQLKKYRKKQKIQKNRLNKNIRASDREKSYLKPFY